MHACQLLFCTILHNNLLYDKKPYCTVPLLYFNMFWFAVNGSEDVDLLPNGLAIISSISQTYPVFVIIIILRVVQVGTIFLVDITMFN